MNLGQPFSKWQPNFKIAPFINLSQFPKLDDYRNEVLFSLKLRSPMD